MHTAIDDVTMSQIWCSILDAFDMQSCAKLIHNIIYLIAHVTFVQYLYYIYIYTGHQTLGKNASIMERVGWRGGEPRRTSAARTISSLRCWSLGRTVAILQWWHLAISFSIAWQRGRWLILIWSFYCVPIYIYIVSYFQLYETTEGRWCNMLDWQIVVTLDLNNYMSNQGQESPNESKIVMS